MPILAKKKIIFSDETHFDLSGYVNKQIIAFGAQKTHTPTLKSRSTQNGSFFYLKVQSIHLIMENNFIQMAASAVHVVAYTIGPILKHIIDCVQLYFSNGFTNFVL